MFHITVTISRPDLFWPLIAFLSSVGFFGCLIEDNEQKGSI
jgi:hypothetical protein